MKKIIEVILFRRRFTVACLLCFAVIANAQQNLMQIGLSSYTRAAGTSLRQPVDFSPRFFRSVGGVAFQAVAVGREGSRVSDIQYDPKQTDGQRLIVTLADNNGEQRSFSPLIYDWELIPIARFAASVFGSAMTLFGNLHDKQQEQQLKRQGAQIINYHDSLQDTLLGLRLMQADLLLFDAGAIDLPKIGDQYLLGAGEQVPDLDKNTMGFRRVQVKLVSQNFKGHDYRSYVVGDLDTPVEFGVEQGRLVFYGHPSWTFWRDDENVEQLMQRVGSIIESSDAEFLQSDPIDESQLDGLLETHLSEPDFALYKALKNDEAMVEMLPELSQTMTAAIRAEDGINPAVYQALTKTMHYRALFKAYQQEDANGFNRFVNSLDSVEISPQVETPTIRWPSLLN